MNTITISDRVVRALCDTLLHSLWQGLLLAGLAGLIVVCTRKASSALRYNLLVSALILFAAGVSVTFTLQYLRTGDTPPSQPINHPVNAVGIMTPAPISPSAAIPPPAFTDRVTAWLNAHHNTIVLVWFLIICVRSLQLGVGLYGTYRLKRDQVLTVKDHWPERMRQLARVLGIRQTIALLESGLTKAPVMIGWLKPVILVPLGLLTALSPAEVEAILIHELAHIKRRDYLVNLLQNLLEIVFFFNPAVLWVSTLIRTERENCCDDLVLAHDKNKATYIRALVSCEEYQSSVPHYALAFSGHRNTLLHRVRRLVNNRNHSLNLLEKTILTLCLIGAGLFVTAFSVKKVAPTHQAPTISSPIMRSGKTMVDKMRSSLVVSVPRSGPISGPKYRDLKPERAPLTEPSPLEPPDTAAPPKKDTIVRQINPDPADTLVKEKDTQPDSYASPYGQSNAERNYERERQALEREQQALERERQAIERKRAYLDRERSYLDHHKNYSDHQKEYESAEAAIKLDLIKEGLVSDTNHIHFTINEKEFILNGVTQSAEVHRRYMDKYCPARGAAGWSWSHSTNKP